MIRRALIVALLILAVAGPSNAGGSRTETRTYIGPGVSTLCLVDDDNCLSGMEMPVPSGFDRVKITIADVALEPAGAFYFLWDAEEIVASGPFCGKRTLSIPKDVVRLRVSAGYPTGCDPVTAATVGTITATFS